MKVGAPSPVIIGGAQGAVAATAIAESGRPEKTERVEHWRRFVFTDEAEGRMNWVPHELEERDGPGCRRKSRSRRR